MNNCTKFTSSQIRYMIWLSRLSVNGVGVKNVELATALEFSKPSVHNMLKWLAEAGIITRETYGLAHLTEDGAVLSKKYETCFSLIEWKMFELFGENSISENSICGVLADLSLERIDELCRGERGRG